MVLIGFHKIQWKKNHKYKKWDCFAQWFIKVDKHDFDQPGDASHLYNIIKCLCVSSVRPDVGGTTVICVCESWRGGYTCMQNIK